MSDLYTKICLTVIALALVAHVVLQWAFTKAYVGWPFGAEWEQAAKEVDAAWGKRPVPPRGR